MERKWKSKKKLAGSQMYRPWKEYREGDVVIGEMCGTHIDNYGNTCIKVKVEEAMTYDKKFNEEVAGKVLVINSAGFLSKLLEEEAIKDGDMLQIEYTGTIEISKGKYAGKTAHTAEVEIVELEEVEEDDEYEGDVL